MTGSRQTGSRQTASRTLSGGLLGAVWLDPVGLDPVSLDTVYLDPEGAETPPPRDGRDGQKTSQSTLRRSIIVQVGLIRSTGVVLVVLVLVFVVRGWF